MPIKIFITGGTIDSINQSSGKTFSQYGKTHLPKMLKQARITEKILVEKLFLKDSRNLTDSDRKLILKKCKQCKEDKIIITHGTFTMAETAKFLGQRVKNKTIVLTGSMVPFAKKNSDALFNLGFALGAIKLLPKGVYVAMNGRIFDCNNVKKNVKKGIFEKIK